MRTRVPDIYFDCSRFYTSAVGWRIGDRSSFIFPGRFILIGFESGHLSCLGNRTESPVLLELIPPAHIILTADPQVWPWEVWRGSVSHTLFICPRYCAILL